jgi:chromosome partitioning protein
MLIAVATRKGGVGKTTIATNLAVARAASGYATKLVDTDPEKFAFMWGGTRSEFGVLPEIPSAFMEGAIHHALMAERANTDTVIVDCAGKNSPELVHAIAACDVLVMPYSPGQYEVWSLMTMAQMVAKYRAAGHQIRVVPVMNLLDPQQPTSPLARALEDQMLGHFTEPIVKLNDRVAYKYAAPKGQGVLEQKRNRDNAKAQEEFALLYQEVFNEYPKHAVRPDADAVAGDRADGSGSAGGQGGRAVEPADG